MGDLGAELLPLAPGRERAAAVPAALLPGTVRQTLLSMSAPACTAQKCPSNLVILPGVSARGHRGRDGRLFFRGRRRGGQRLRGFRA